MVHVSVLLDQPANVVWEYIRDISSHTQWMKDAHSIEIISTEREGVGTTFVCDTRVGPIKLLDKMEITEWETESRMAIKHGGIIKGNGVFILQPMGEQTRFVWQESLEVPWWLGGKLALVVIESVLRPIWKRNLQSLREQLLLQATK